MKAKPPSQRFGKTAKVMADPVPTSLETLAYDLEPPETGNREVEAGNLEGGHK